MPTHTQANAPLGAGYHGFSGPPPHRLIDDEPPRRRGPAMAAGLTAALALGLGFGLWAKPDLLRLPKPMAPSPATAAATGPDGQVKIVVNPARPAPAPTPAPSAAPLEVLPPDMAAAARAQVEREAMRPVIPPPAATLPDPTVEAAPAPAPRARPAFNCADASTPSERMVCGDQRLAAADRRMDQAYRRAVAAGAPPAELRAEQDDWLMIREDAARYSSQAVADAYRQRIDELERMTGPAGGW